MGEGRGVTLLVAVILDRRGFSLDRSEAEGRAFNDLFLVLVAVQPIENLRPGGWLLRIGKAEPLFLHRAKGLRDAHCA